MQPNPGKHREVDIRDIISSAKMELGIDNMDMDLYFLKLTNEAVRSLGALSIFIPKRECLPICDNKVQLPCGFNQLILLSINDGHNKLNGLNQYLYIDTNLLSLNGVSLNNGQYLYYGGSIEIVGDYIHFSSAQQATECTLVYFGLNVDEHGFMKVYDYYERGLTAYLCYKYARQNFKDYGQYIIEDYKREWIKQKQYIKGLDNQSNAQDNMWQLKRIFGAWMLNQNSQEFNFNAMPY